MAAVPAPRVASSHVAARGTPRPGVVPEATAALSNDQTVASPPSFPIEITAQPRAFAKRDPRSQTGRKKGDSAQALDFSKNKQIGRFELIREIARGGMGQVFLG